MRNECARFWRRVSAYSLGIYIWAKKGIEVIILIGYINEEGFSEKFVVRVVTAGGNVGVCGVA